MIIKFWHTGLTVENLDDAIEQYQALGFKLVKRIEKPEPKAVAAFMDHPSGSGVELWQWFDKDHPEVKFIRNHLAFMSDDLDNDVEKLKKQGFEVVIPKTEGVVVNYVFVRDGSGNYFEIATEKPE